MVQFRSSETLVFLAIVVVITTSLVSCGLFQEGTLIPGITPEYGSSVNTAKRAPDGRSIAFGMPIMLNDSTTEPLHITGVRLVEGVGLEIDEAYSSSMDSQIMIGSPVPPKPEEWPAEREEEFHMLEDWEKIIPISDTVIAAQEYRQLVLVMRPTTDEECVWARGFIVDYEQHGRKHSALSSMAMIIYTGELLDACQDVKDDLREHPLQ